MYYVKVLTLPAAWFCLHYGLSVDSVMYCYIGFEIVCMLTRLPFLKITAGLNIGHFIKNVFLPLIIPTAVIVVTCYAMTYCVNFSYRFALTIIVAVSAYVFSVWMFGLSRNEKKIISDIINKKILHKK